MVLVSSKGMEHLETKISRYFVHLRPESSVSFYSAEVKAFQRVIDAKAIFASILADLVEILLDEFLLLNKLDIGQGFRGQFNCLSTKDVNTLNDLNILIHYLVESILPPIAHINDLDDFSREPGIKHVTLIEFGLEVGTASKH